MIEEINIEITKKELEYLKANGIKFEKDDFNNNMFPLDWYYQSDEFKEEVLDEAIAKKIKILDTNKYQEAIEGVKFDN